MKAISMPISSPSRTESFPPPLMRFLRSNVGSSRGRTSRLSPIFYVRAKLRNADDAAAQQEPSSPKVTCIGQVRSAKSGATASNHRRRRRKAPLFAKISSRFYCRRRAFGRFFSKWFLFLKAANYCRNVDAEEGHFRVQKREKGENIFYRGKYLEGEIQEKDRDFLDDECSSSPPRNV